MPVFTFGYGHECKCGRPLDDCYTMLPDRTAMIASWGVQWAGQYPDGREVGMVSLKRIDTNTDNLERCVCNRGPRPDYQLFRQDCTYCDEYMGDMIARLDMPETLAATRTVKATGGFICARCKKSDLPR